LVRANARHRVAVTAATSSRRKPTVIALAVAVGLIAATLTVIVGLGQSGDPKATDASLQAYLNKSSGSSTSDRALLGPGLDPSDPDWTGGASGSSSPADPASPTGSTGSSTAGSPTAPGSTSGASSSGSTGAPGSAGSSGSTSAAAAPPAVTSVGVTSGSAGVPAKAPAVTSVSPPPTVNAHPTSVNITANIAASPSNDASCAGAPTGAACVNAGVAALNHARAVLNLPAYVLAPGFVSLSPAQQLLALSNADRSLYGLQPIAGLNATINTAAQGGVTSGGDPAGVNVGSAQWTSWASNWASGYPNAVFTYYAWMYDDGLGSPNGDCTASNSSGCWGHRLNTLHSFGSGVQIAMGVGSSGKVFTELYESFAASAAIPYS